MDCGEIKRFDMEVPNLIEIVTNNESTRVRDIDIGYQHVRACRSRTTYKGKCESIIVSWSNECDYRLEIRSFCAEPLVYLSYMGGAMMSLPDKPSLELEIAEIMRLIDEYQEKIANGTSSVDNFMSITDMEKALGALRDGTNNIYAEIQSKLINQVDESELVRKKNGLSTPRNQSKNAEQR